MFPAAVLTRSMFYHGPDAGKTKAVAMDAKDLASRLDVTVARPDALAPDVHKAAADAMRFGVACLFTTPVWTSRLATMLRGSGVAVAALVAFPHGGSKATIKAIEATSAVKDGADRIEIVPHLANLLALEIDAARQELIEIARAARAARRDIHLSAFIDIPLLFNRRGERAVELACRAVREGAFDGIVIPTAADAHAIGLAKTHGQSLAIKVAGIADAAAGRAALADGAVDRIGIDANDVEAMMRHDDDSDGT
jgi:deoxyribose-phosphate aldolase